ncbi:MAG: hypothetical protein HKN20_05655, partial [Gemmatimonadetes bacterium]|nr:hypothetical protein [Gemmatimonadota bacterium]
MNARPKAKKAWWKPITLETGQCAVWTVGAISLVACRTDFGWKCAVRSIDPVADLTAAGVCRKVPELPAPDEELDWQIFTFKGENDSIRAVPRTTDRAVVFKPDGTLILPPGEDVRLTLDSPPTIEIRAGKKESALLEHPSEVLSETWFGSNTTDGECCYSSTYP